MFLQLITFYVIKAVLACKIIYIYIYIFLLLTENTTWMSRLETAVYSFDRQNVILKTVPPKRSQRMFQQLHHN